MEKKMTERQKIVEETSKAQKKMTDLRDMLDDGVPANMRRVILRQINVLSDIIFYNQEYLNNCS